MTDSIPDLVARLRAQHAESSWRGSARSKSSAVAARSYPALLDLVEAADAVIDASGPAHLQPVNSVHIHRLTAALTKAVAALSGDTP